jgi:hypothetical protein
MDLEAVLLTLAERERWLSRQAAIEEDLERVRKQLKLAEKKRKKLTRERVRLEEVAAKLSPDGHNSERGQQRDNNGRVTPFSIIR